MNHSVTKLAYQKNPYQDSNLGFCCDFDALAERLFYLRTNWLFENEGARILVTGARQWIGHHLLHILTQKLNFAEILAVDSVKLPDYLKMGRYKQVRYVSLSRKFQELQTLIGTFKPALIFHCDGVWNPNEQNTNKIYETNVCQTEILCQAAAQAHVKRIIFFSDSLIYGAGQEIVFEDHPLQPITFLGHSFAESEKIAQEYHDTQAIECYHLRFAPLYGPLISTGIMMLARLVANGLLLGFPQGMPKETSLVSGHDLALAAFLTAIAPKPNYRVFNVCSPKIETQQIIEKICALTPKQKILGIKTRLAEIIQFGYQDKVMLPRPWLEFMTSFYENSHDFLNQLRFVPQEAFISRALTTSLMSWRVMSSKRLADMLGWTPPVAWKQLEASLPIRNEAKENKHDKLPSHKALPSLVSLFDGVAQLMDAIDGYRSDHTSSYQSLSIPLLELEMDSKSLWILMERSWSIFWFSALNWRGNGNKINIFQFLPMVAESILNLIRYEQDKACRLYPGDLKKQIDWLTLKIGELKGNKLRYYLNILIFCELISYAKEQLNHYKPLVQLLPEKNYGLLIVTEIGDVGVVLRVKQGQILIDFPRKQVDTLQHKGSFSRRLKEFQKMAKLHIVLGIRWETFLRDLLKGTIIESFRESFGRDYILSGTTDHYPMIARAVQKSNINTYLFLDKSNHAICGIRLRGRSMKMLSQDYLATINEMIDQWQDHKEVVQILSLTSQGEEEIAFFRVKTIRRLLGGMITPSRIHKLILKLLERASRL